MIQIQKLSNKNCWFYFIIVEFFSFILRFLFYKYHNILVVFKKCFNDKFYIFVVRVVKLKINKLRFKRMFHERKKMRRNCHRKRCECYLEFKLSPLYFKILKMLPCSICLNKIDVLFYHE